MHLPGIVEITPGHPELVERAARVVGTSFLEERWFAYWLSSLDALGIDRARKEAILRAYFLGCLEAHAPRHAVWATDDFAAVAGGYLASEFGDDVTHAELEAESSMTHLSTLLTDPEKSALEKAEQKLAPVSDFAWATSHARRDFEEGLRSTDDHVYFYAWAVDPEKRGSGAFRRLVTPFFDYADMHDVNVYLECYSDELQSLYEHVGFELVRTLETPGIAIVERCMVRRPRADR